MLKKRVIFTLLYDSGSFMLSRNFRLQKVGDLHWLQKNYDFSQLAFSIDELIVLDVSSGERIISRFCDHVRALTENCFVPIAAGGGVRSVEDARTLLRSGADKIVVNSILGADPETVCGIATEFGRQCIVASVDAKRGSNGFSVWTENGRKPADCELSDWLGKVISLPIGELYLNSMDRDGTGQGYDVALLDDLPSPMPIPVILAGGAGKYQHLAQGLADTRVDAVATAHLFNFVGDGLQKARADLLRSGFRLAVWDQPGSLNA